MNAHQRRVAKRKLERSRREYEQMVGVKVDWNLTSDEYLLLQHAQLRSLRQSLYSTKVNGFELRTGIDPEIGCALPRDGKTYHVECVVDGYLFSADATIGRESRIETGDL